MKQVHYRETETKRSIVELFRKMDEIIELWVQHFIEQIDRSLNEYEYD